MPKDEADQITYIDYGDHTLEIDDRGPVQQRRRLPKSTRDGAVSAATRKELEERIETEIKPLQELRKQEAEANPEDLLPPVEDPDAVEEREKKASEQLAEANKKQDERQEQAQEEVKASQKKS